MKIKNISLNNKLLIVNLASVTLLGLVIIILCFTEISNTIYLQTENSLNATAMSVKAAYEQNTGEYFKNTNGDIWKGGYNISKSEDLLDSIKENTNMDVTFFYGSKRIVTSVKDSNGERIVGSPAGNKIQEEVLKKGNKYFTKLVSIDGTRFCGYYIPITQNNSKEIIGMIFVGSPKSIIDRQILQVCFMIGGVVALFIAIIAIITIRISKNIVGGIKSGLKSLSDISKGDLTTEIDNTLLKREDETGELIKGTKELKEGLTEILSTIISNADVLDNSSNNMDLVIKNTVEEINKMKEAINDIDLSAKNEAKSVSSVAENISKIENMIENTNNEAKVLIEYASNMQSSIVSANKTLDVLQNINVEVLSEIEQIHSDTTNTNEAVSKINKAVDIIKDIAEQTNLLSLNASIEAARAGEAGKGFSVVAEQIQQLAEQSTKSSEDISSILLNLNASSNNSVNTMKDVRNVINKQSNNIEETKLIFNNVSNEITSSIEGIKEIENAINGLIFAKNEIVNSINNLSNESKENETNTDMALKSVLEVSDGVKSLKESSNDVKSIADDINNNIKVFKLQ